MVTLSFGIPNYAAAMLGEKEMAASGLMLSLPMLFRQDKYYREGQKSRHIRFFRGQFKSTLQNHPIGGRSKITIQQIDFPPSIFPPSIFEFIIFHTCLKPAIQ